VSDRDKTPTRDALATWRKSVDTQLQQLQQRPIGSPNGLIVTGGGAGTWSPLSFANAWGQFDAAHQPQAALDADGFAHLRGLVGHSVSWPVGQVAVLPVAAPKDEYFPCACFNGTSVGVAVLSTNGTALTLVATPTIAWGGGGWISLSGILFYAGAQ
jgi:hypothetical protein